MLFLGEKICQHVKGHSSLIWNLQEYMVFLACVKIIFFLYLGFVTSCHYITDFSSNTDICLFFLVNMNFTNLMLDFTWREMYLSKSQKESGATTLSKLKLIGLGNPLKRWLTKFKINRYIHINILDLTPGIILCETKLEFITIHLP